MYVFPGNIHIRIYMYIYIFTSFCGGHVNLGGGEKNCVANLFHSQPIALSEKKVVISMIGGKWPAKKEYGIKGTEYFHQKTKKT